jgi:hypothetical protein
MNPSKGKARSESKDNSRHTSEIGVNLHLRWPIGQTLTLSLIMLVGMVALGEGLIRRSQFQHPRPPLSVGSSHRVFEIKISLLDDQLLHQGSIDCVFLGSSSVARAIDPQTIHRTYQQRTGRPIQCFNFGLQGLNPVAAGQISGLIVERYRPSVLIYGVDIIGFAESRGVSAEESLLDVPWVQYQLGELSLEEWLVENFYGLRMYMLVRNWMLKDFFTDIFRKMNWGGHFDEYGYRQDTGAGIDVTEPADINARPIFKQLTGYEVAARQLDGLKQVLAEKNETQLLVFETPLYPTMMQFLDSGEESYMEYLLQIRSISESYGVPFWMVWGQVDLPPEDWLNRNHLNDEGAQRFSRWVGEKLAWAVSAGELTIP